MQDFKKERANNMKADKLMIGDWVQINFRDKKVKVTGIHDGLIETNVVSPLRSDEYKPIPLTREILEAIGFHDTYVSMTLEKDNVYKSYDYYGHCVAVDMNENKIKIMHDSRVLLDLWYNYTICVHDLQHNMRMCGVEKEVVL